MRRLAAITVAILAIGSLASAQALPQLDAAAVARVDRTLDESSCDRDSRSLGAQALRELEGAFDASGRYEARRLPTPLLQALGALAHTVGSSRGAVIREALGSTDGSAAIRVQCGAPEALWRRTDPMSPEERVREVWRTCRIDSVGLTRPRRDLEAADGFVQVVAAVVGHLTRASGRLEPVEIRLLQTMASGSAPRCGTATAPASGETPSWLRDAPPPSRREEDDRRYQIEP